MHDPSSGTQAATPQQLQRSAALSAPTNERQDAAGRYELRGEIARGGMGVVMRAWDNTLHREVAVKLLHPQMVGSSAEQQFLEEANITGQLQHPGIPPVYDLGTFTDGRPFLAMKLVNGRTFDVLLKEAPTDRGRWIGVFESICQAVGYAHANGVIHRDLKPQNVMVGSFGEVQVMDWGLAKVLASGGRQPPDSRTDPETPGDTKVGSGDTPFHNPRGDSETAPGNAMGTPAYMPPEQARGDVASITERSDVFGLGAVLCAILTGKPPFLGSDGFSSYRQAAEGNLTDAISRIEACGAEPELIALAKRCLAPVSADRPANGAEVAAEVANLRADAERRAKQAEMDRARAEVQSAEQRKRQRVRMWWATAVATVLVAGTSVSVWLTVRATTAESKATDRENKATFARDKMRDVLDAMVSEVTGTAITAQEKISPEQIQFLQTVLTYYREFAAEQSDMEDAMSRTASAAFKVGAIESRLGRVAESVNAYSHALEIRKKLANGFPGMKTYRQDLAGTHNNLARQLSALGRRNDAREQFEMSLAIRETLTREDPANYDFRKDLAASYANLGKFLIGDQDIIQGERRYGQALEIYESLAKESPTGAEVRSNTARLYSSLGDLHDSKGSRDIAAEHYSTAIRLLNDLTKDFPRVAEYREQLADYSNSHGVLLRILGNNDSAVAHNRTAVAILQQLSTDFPTDPTYRSKLASCRKSLSELLRDGGKNDEALDQLRQALTLRERLAAEHPKIQSYRSDVTMIHNRLGLLLRELDRLDDAEAQFRRAIHLFQIVLAEFPNSADDRQDLAGFHGNLATVLFFKGRHREAEQEYGRVLAIQEQLVEEFPTQLIYRQNLGNCLSNLGNIIRDGGELSKAILIYGRAIDSLEREFLLDSRDINTRFFLRNAYWGRAVTHDRMTKFPEAIKDWDRAMEFAKQDDRSAFRAHRANSLIQAGRTDEAVSEVCEMTKSPGWDAESLYDFACIYSMASGKRKANREEYSVRAIELLNQSCRAGWNDVLHIKQDTSLNPLRTRSDFQSLIADLAKKFPGPHERAPPPREVRP